MKKPSGVGLNCTEWKEKSNAITISGGLEKTNPPLIF